jgi:Fe-S-cluster-containing dehydrogenase component
MQSLKNKYAMVIDTKLCIGCGDCVVACKVENMVPDGLHRDWIVEETTGVFPNLEMEIRSERCNHCSNPPCVDSCPTGASFIDQNSNITLVNSSKCTGCKACVASCPYDARFVMPEGYISKCTFCHHRTIKGELPACANTCPTHCIHFGNLNNPLSTVSRLLRSRKYKALVTEAGTEPNVFYLL